MIILALGTNIEPREQYLKDALRKIEASNLKIKKLSSVYETPAWGGVADQNFLNMCIEIETSIEVYELLDTIQKIELELGRIRKEHWGNRTIDIDIITYNNLVFNDDRLIVPHKYIYERNFVSCSITTGGQHMIFFINQYWINNDNNRAQSPRWMNKWVVDQPW